MVDLRQLKNSELYAAALSKEVACEIGRRCLMMPDVATIPAEFQQAWMDGVVASVSAGSSINKDIERFRESRLAVVRYAIVRRYQQRAENDPDHSNNLEALLHGKVYEERPTLEECIQYMRWQNS